MKTERKQDLLKTIEKSRGATGIIWSYTVSHSELVVRIEWPGRVGNTHLICGGCQRVEMSSMWQGLNLIFKEVGTDLYILEDVGAKFRVECEFIRVLRDVEPVFK